MYLHKQFIKEHIGTDRKAQNDFAFFLLLKASLSNGVIYSGTTLKELSDFVKRDSRTTSKYLANIKARGWARPSGEHLKLKSINKEYEYKLKPNGKADKKKNSKYFRIRVKKDMTLKQIRNIVRGLLVKPHYQKQLFVEKKGKMEQISRKGLKRIWDTAYKLGYKRNAGSLAEKSSVTIPIRLIGKAMGVSKSTAYRTVSGLAQDQFIVKYSFDAKMRGKEENLKVNKLPYGIYTFNGNVYHKPVCSYVF